MCALLVPFPTARAPVGDKVMASEARVLHRRGCGGPQGWHCTWLPVPGSTLGL